MQFFEPHYISFMEAAIFLNGDRAVLRGKILLKMFVGEYQSPFAGKDKVQNINKPIYSKQPHKNKMKAHTFCKPERNVECLIK